MFAKITESEEKNSIHRLDLSNVVQQIQGDSCAPPPAHLCPPASYTISHNIIGKKKSKEGIA